MTHYTILKLETSFRSSCDAAAISSALTSLPNHPDSAATPSTSTLLVEIVLAPRTVTVRPHERPNTLDASSLSSLCQGQLRQPPISRAQQVETRLCFTASNVAETITWKRCGRAHDCQAHLRPKGSLCHVRLRPPLCSNLRLASIKVPQKVRGIIIPMMITARAKTSENTRAAPVDLVTS